MNQEVTSAKTALVSALSHAHHAWSRLGFLGLEEVGKQNQFNEHSLRADIDCEDAVIRSLQMKGFPVRIHSEEHGVVNVGPKQEFTAVLDGIDGTADYKKNPRMGKYGTMLSIFSGTDPCYSDYLACGIMQHATYTMFAAFRHMGAFSESHSQQAPLKASQRTLFSPKRLKVYVDESFEINQEAFSRKLSDFNIECTLCSCQYYADLVSGHADYVLECTRKNNLELMAAYGLVREAGGVMVDLDGNDIGPRRYLEFGQGKDEHIPVITAANLPLAEQLISLLATR
jgi:fructose-1,6-bisphosphatase/inositol monophosphatase family enzyme